MTDEREILLSLEGLTKAFGGNQALAGVSMKVRSGTAHGLIGPNGAGKSTLIKILDGVLEADAGRVTVNARNGGRAGRVGVIHQDLGLVEALTIRQNLHLSPGGPRRARVFLDHRREREATRMALDRLTHVDLAPDARVADLTLGERTLVAIVRLLAEDAEVIVLDEVTAALTKGESKWLFEHMRDFTSVGGAFVVVSHRLHEIVEECDFVTLLRDGRVGYDGETPTLAELHDLFAAANRSAFDYQRRASDAAPRGQVILEARAASGKDVAPFDLEVRAGEVVALVGPLSSSLYDVAYLLAGRLELEGGSLEVHPRSRDEKRKGAVGFLSEDRKRNGNLTGLKVGANLALSGLEFHAKAGWMKNRAERAALMSTMTRMKVHPPSLSNPIEALSGGNQQKVLFGRAMLARPDLYVLCEPTRGVDVNARHAIHDFIREVTAEGCAAVIATIDLDDALAVADRIALVVGDEVEIPIPIDEVDPAALLERLS